MVFQIGFNTSTRNIVIACLLLSTITFGVYFKTASHEFLNYDDAEYVTENPHVVSGITGSNIFWAFTTSHSANWHPITWISHMLDVQIYGMNPRGHHITNVIIHTVNSVLLLLLLLRFSGALWQSLFVAALFALHPLHVESVAWIAERKDVLSAFFCFLTLLFYGEYSRNLKPAFYILAFLSFMLGLMSKPMLVTLPVIMLLVDLWPLDRYRYARDDQCLRHLFGRFLSLVKEKIPFFLLSVLSAIVTFLAQALDNSVVSPHDIDFNIRTINIVISYVKYIVKTIFPHNLAVYYPYPTSFQIWMIFVSFTILIIVTTLVIRFGREYPYLPMGWFWFLFTLVPVIGLIQVGSQSMADRYSYIPLVGLFIMVAWGIPDLTRGLKHRNSLLTFFASAIIFISAILTWQQLDYWRDSTSLFKHALQVTTDNDVAHYTLGLALFHKGDLDGAIKEFQETLIITPDFKGANIVLEKAIALKNISNQSE
ncbi:MAG: tetratricopeptide repeat protein [Desulfuromonadales bacterium]|nr:tetratricopeptide repeat protein [Desulfuromonadales bacterium]